MTLLVGIGLSWVLVPGCVTYLIVMAVRRPAVVIALTSTHVVGLDSAITRLTRPRITHLPWPEPLRCALLPLFFDDVPTQKRVSHARTHPHSCAVQVIDAIKPAIDRWLLKHR